MYVEYIRNGDGCARIDRNQDLWSIWLQSRFRTLRITKSAFLPLQIKTGTIRLGTAIISLCFCLSFIAIM